jgi:MFS transporter, FSR family, fosmidomycin resistance protein
LLAVALAVEFADELVDGVKSAEMPAIQHSLGISYAQIGLLTAVPLLVGGLLELPAGLLPNRRAGILGGGVLFVLSLAGMAFAQNFAELVVAITLFFPASGFFVSLTQASLMDADPDRQAQLMARWDAAGWTGAVAGPLLLIAVLAAGGSWRIAFLVVAAVGAVAWAGVAWAGVARAGVARYGGREPAGAAEDEERAGIRDVLAGGRTAWRWLLLLEVADLLVDVLSGFVAVYLVHAGHTTTVIAAVAVTIRLGAGLAGDALLVAALERFDDRTVLRVTAVAAAVLYPAFLLVPELPAKVAVLAVLSAVTATWYPLLKARLYGSVPSPVAVTLSTATGMVAAVGPLAVGVAAGVFGLTWALGGLGVVPFVLFALAGSQAAGSRAVRHRE